jgi:hypothetical protein
VGVRGTPLMRESEDVAEGEGAVKRPRRELLRSAEEPRYGRSYLLLENPGLQPWPCVVFGHSHGAVVVMRRRVGPHWAQRAALNVAGRALKRCGCAGTLPQSALEVVTADLGVKRSCLESRFPRRRSLRPGSRPHRLGVSEPQSDQPDRPQPGAGPSTGANQRCPPSHPESA